MKKIEIELSTTTMDTLREMFERSNTKTSEAPFKVSRQKTHKPGKSIPTERASLVSENNIFMGRDEDGKPFAYVILQDNLRKDMTYIIGTGTYGTTYNALKVVQTSEGEFHFTPVAIKKLDLRGIFSREVNKSREYSISARNVIDEEREKEATAVLSPNELILGKATGLIRSSIETVDEQGGKKKVYIEMPKIEGEPLYTALKNNQYSIEQIETIVINLLREMSHYHQEQFRHNDGKPENVMVAPDLSVKIIDWGLAENPRLGIEYPSNAKGTMGYIAFESLITGERSEKTDSYSFGAIILDLLTEHAKYKAEPMFNSGLEDYLLKLNQGKDFIRLHNDLNANWYDITLEDEPDHFIQNIPSYLVDLVRKMTLCNPKNRLTCTEALQHIPKDILAKHPDKTKEGSPAVEVSIVEVNAGYNNQLDDLKYAYDSLYDDMTDLEHGKSFLSAIGIENTADDFEATTLVRGFSDLPFRKMPLFELSNNQNAEDIASNRSALLNLLTLHEHSKALVEKSPLIKSVFDEQINIILKNTRAQFALSKELSHRIGAMLNELKPNNKLASAFMQRNRLATAYTPGRSGLLASTGNNIKSPNTSPTIKAKSPDFTPLDSPSFSSDSGSASSHRTVDSTPRK